MEKDCEYCRGAGWYGDNGPGVRGNKEYHKCDQCENHGLPACKHGHLARTCELCEMEEEIERLKCVIELSANNKTPKTIICEHSQLSRSCELCEMEAEISSLKEKNFSATKTALDYFTGYVELQEENKLLKTKCRRMAEYIANIGECPKEQCEWNNPDDCNKVCNTDWYQQIDCWLLYFDSDKEGKCSS